MTFWEKQNNNSFLWLVESQTSKVSAPELENPVQNISKPASSMSKTPISIQKPLDLSQINHILESSHKQPAKSIDPSKSICISPSNSPKPFLNYESIPESINLPNPQKVLVKQIYSSTKFSHKSIKP